MKQYLPVNFLSLLFVGVLWLALWPNSAQGQTANCPTPYDVPEFQSRSHAFITHGNQGLVPWINTGDSSIWVRCKTQGQSVTIEPWNTPNPSSNTNNIYLEIKAGDTVHIRDLRLNNRFTLVICGSLTLGTLTIDSTLTGDGDLTGLNNVRIIVCPGGSFTLDELNAQNNVILNINGVLKVNRITGQSSGLCIMGTGIIQTPSGGIPDITERWLFGTTPDAPCRSEDPVQGGVVLPVELLSFNTFVNREGVELRWATATEINNDCFTIERSNDLRMWEVLGFVGGSGTTSRPNSYSFTDTQPLAGIGYYRMKQTDFDGQYKYYGPVAAHFDLGLEGLEFRVIRQFSHWMIAVPDDGFYTVEVYNLQGRKLISRETQNILSIEAPKEPVIIRVTDGLSRSASQVFMN